MGSRSPLYVLLTSPASRLPIPLFSYFPCHLGIGILRAVGSNGILMIRNGKGQAFKPVPEFFEMHLSASI